MGRGERPRRHVYLDPCFIDKYGVTNEVLRKCERPEKDFGEKFNGKKQPVVGATRFQARGCCRSVRKRLPTEVEWEKAARGPDGSKYPWGNFWISTNVIWKKNSLKKTHPVDRNHNTSPYGVSEMIGNAFEWGEDWYDPEYDKRMPTRNPKGASHGLLRVYRGGAWDVTTRHAFRASRRCRGHPYKAVDNLGFRCVRDPR